MRVVVADDAVLIREGLAHLFLRAGFEVAAAVECGDDLLPAVADTAPDVVITDIKMPPTFTHEGIQAAEQIKQHWPQVGVMVLSQYVEVRYVAKLLRSSGTGYLLKDRVANGDEFINAVVRVASGDTVVDTDLVRTLMERRRLHNSLERLTTSERAILQLMAEGCSNEAIAEAAYVSGKTVETHIRRIFTKLGLEPSPLQHRRVLAVIEYLRRDRPA